jgi:predicted transcriptional regulator of viral defense system
MTKEYRQVRYWVDDLPKTGRSSFSFNEACAQFPKLPPDYVKNALYRLSVAGKVKSVWKGYYAVLLPEYGLDGIVPQVEYIDQLMSYIGADYYIALLSAASFQGASHQAAQVFQVIANKPLRTKNKDDVQLEFAFKKEIAKEFLAQKVVNSGMVNISVPELTALDLVSYPARAGGLSYVANVLSELAEKFDFKALDSSFFQRVPRVSIQRLGYLLDAVLDENDLADSLYENSLQAGVRFKRTSLVSALPSLGKPCNEKWQIVANYDVEVDE